MINQNGLKWNDDQGCLVRGTTVGGKTASNLGQATTEAMFMVVATRSSTLHHDGDFSWVEGFSSYLFYCVMEFCLWKYYNMYVSTETPIIASFLTQFFFLILI